MKKKGPIRKKKKKLTKSHKLRPNSNQKHNQIQHFHLLKIRVQCMSDEDNSDVEQERFSQVYNPLVTS